MKPLNILIDRVKGKEILRITDFGLAKNKFAPKSHETSQNSKPTGTHDFISPEREAGDHNSEKEDVWALGCIAQQLCQFSHDSFPH